MNIQTILTSVNSKNLKNTQADIRVGETVKVHYKIKEGNKERIQVFQGLVIGTKAGKTVQGSFTVRKVVSGIGVERTFPLSSPWIVKIERVKSGKVRQAKLNYVRRFALSSKFKLKDKNIAGTVFEDVVQTEEVPSAETLTEESTVPEEVAEVAEAETSSETEPETKETTEETV